MTKITTDAQAKLPDPAAVLYPDIGFRQDAAAIALWRNHGYDTGVEPFYSADQLHSYACARVAAARLASTSPAPDGWQPIETAPKDGTRVLLASDAGTWVAEYRPVYQSGYRPKNPWASMMLNHDHIQREQRSRPPTHWQPLPASPQPVVEKDNG